jgi:hypothetical protein
VHVEGLTSITKESLPPVFFGAKMCSDAVLTAPDGQFRIAIELDHGDKGLFLI